MNVGYVIGASVVMRKLGKQCDANLDPMSLVFPTIGISLFEPISQNPIFFCVTWPDLNTYFSLQEGDLNAGNLACSFL